MSFRYTYYIMNLNDIGEHKNQPVNQLDSLVESRIQWIRDSNNESIGFVVWFLCSPMLFGFMI